jgi:hypothetical protein
MASRVRGREWATASLAVNPIELPWRSGSLAPCAPVRGARIDVHHSGGCAHGGLKATPEQITIVSSDGDDPDLGHDSSCPALCGEPTSLREVGQGLGRADEDPFASPSHG